MRSKKKNRLGDTIRVLSPLQCNLAIKFIKWYKIIVEPDNPIR